MINVMERGRRAYISLCISVMYMEEIRGAREGEGETSESCAFLLRYSPCVGDNLNEKKDVRRQGGES